MNALIVYAHPEPRSFTAAMKEVALQTLSGLGKALRALPGVEGLPEVWIPC